MPHSLESPLLAMTSCYIHAKNSKVSAETASLSEEYYSLLLTQGNWLRVLLRVVTMLALVNKETKITITTDKLLMTNM